MHLCKVGKVRYTILVYRKNSFPYKNKMLMKASVARKPIMNKNVKTNKLPL